MGIAIIYMKEKSNNGSLYKAEFQKLIMYPLYFSICPQFSSINIPLVCKKSKINAIFVYLKANL